MPIPYGLILKGTVMRIGEEPRYSKDAWGLECEFTKDFLYTNKERLSLELSVRHTPNGWRHEVVNLSEMSDTNELIFTPNMSNQEATYLLKQD